MRVLIVGLRERECSDFLACCSQHSVDAVCATRDEVSAVSRREHVDAILWGPEDLPEAQRGPGGVGTPSAPVLCIMPNPSIPLDELRSLRGDDYLFRPFRPEEAITRLRLMLDKHAPGLAAASADRVRDGIEGRARRCVPCTAALGGRLVVDENVKRARMDGEPLSLTTKEFLLLSLLTRRQGQVISCDEIIRDLWPNKKRASPADVQQYVYKLRRKLEADPRHPEIVLNVKGFGYMLAEPTQSDSGS